ncbi:threonine aldolase family protein [Parasphingorhabdus halotolerans]|uniref:Low specificity L-threonine aldolase n=1 Tax=Parasphingorhabdus halotolerans TaxID=2725558 RepID=A0A6H2DRT3_9SPHN|nr:low specificity L-threonine aldolase [Parasphingorhabdus halotolerans]QJB70693.1 low specificity L-threonine aldolase [Parasphingorhabdus halotolerans]
MRFFSDNAASVHPTVMEALSRANVQDTAYDGDALSAQLSGKFSHVFETDVEAMWVATGTAANSLALAAMCQPHQGVVCHKEAHIEQDEAGAPGFYTGGAKLMLLDGEGAKLSADAVESHCVAIRDDVHQVQPAAVSITNATEYGLVYKPDEVAALSSVCKARGLGLHMDGARFANAVASLGCHPADVTWKVGVDVLSFGFVKNGGMGAEALIFFNKDLAAATHYRRKRAGHLQSKGRFLAAQILAMLDDDLWLKNARVANAGAQVLAIASGDRLLHPVEANEIFIKLTAEEAASLRGAGFDFYDWGAGQARLVTSWNQSAEDIKPLAEAIRAL